MCSFFVSIPPAVTFNIIYEQFELLPLPKDELRKLLLFCTKGVRFQFNNQLYKQTDRVTMGPILANIFLTSLELAKLKHEI